MYSDASIVDVVMNDSNLLLLLVAGAEAGAGAGAGAEADYDSGGDHYHLLNCCCDGIVPPYDWYWRHDKNFLVVVDVVVESLADIDGGIFDDDDDYDVDSLAADHDYYEDTRCAAPVLIGKA